MRYEPLDEIVRRCPGCSLAVYKTDEVCPSCTTILVDYPLDYLPEARTVKQDTSSCSCGTGFAPSRCCQD